MDLPDQIIHTPDAQQDICLINNNTSFVEFSTYEHKTTIWKCKCKKYFQHKNSCEYQEYYELNRIRITFDESVNKFTNYEVSIEANRQLSKEEFGNEKMAIPVENAYKFNMYCNMELNADDETTIFEPHMPFMESLFGINDSINDLQCDIYFRKKRAKGKSINREDFSRKIDEMSKQFHSRAMKICEYQHPKFSKKSIDSGRWWRDQNNKYYHKHYPIVNMLLNKIFQIIIKVRIDELFDDETKENPHVSRKKKIGIC